MVGAPLTRIFSVLLASDEPVLLDRAVEGFGCTGAVRVTKHQSLKFSYSNGTYIQFGGNYQNVSVGWQYSWLGKPN